MTSYILTPENEKRRAIERRYERAMEQPVAHWTQGAAKMLEAALSGYELSKMDKEDREAMELMRSAPGLPQLPGAAPKPSGTDRMVEAIYGPASTAAPGKIYSNNEPSPLDPMPATEGPIAAPARTKVASTSKVWGDDEAVAAGLYDPPSGTTRMADAMTPRGNVSTASPVLTSGRTETMPGKMAQAPQAQQPSMPAQTGPNIPPQVGQYIQQLIANPRTRAQGLQMYQQYLKPADYGFTMTPSGTLLRTDSRGGSASPIYQDPGKSTFGDIGTDPNTGQPLKGFIDAPGRRVDPYAPPASGQPSAIPAPPPGVDPAIWRKQHSERATSDALPPDPKSVASLRGEVQSLPSYKNVAQAAPVYKSMLEAAGRDTRAADVNMIYGLAKIMDPTSVVRESEMTIAQAVATLPQQLQATVASQLQASGRLTPEVRAAIMQEAYGRMSSYQGMFDQDMSMYRGITQRGRMNEADVIPSFGQFDQFKPATKGAPGVDPRLKQKYGLD